MVKRTISAVVVSVSMATSALAADNAFDCMDAKSFEINSQCLQQQIDTNIEFKQSQQTMVADMQMQSDYAMATMRFYPEQMTIEIIAHRDALTTELPNQVAMVSQ